MIKTARKSKKGLAKRSLSVYSSLAYKRSAKAKQRAKAKVKSLRELPRDKKQRFLAHFQWRRIKAYWFSKDGLKRIGKIAVATILLLIIFIGALFLYYKHQLQKIQLNKLKISDTVNTYLDRNGKVLWEDKGDGDYRLVVKGDEISSYMRQATVAIEDKNFYNHAGVDFGALVRATLSTLTGHGVQGGSTLTQQLIKQVYFSNEAANRTVTGLPRKVKELILAVEVEKMYNKEQIITMYLNESPYGGRRNGVESAAQTYFGKSARDLSLAESALLAAIPNNPAVLNPYNSNGNKALLERQHKVLDAMVEMNYINKKEAKEAKEVPLLDKLIPETNQYDNMKAPHFVLEVKSLLEDKYGMQTMRSGGYTIKTTLDYRAQQMAEAAVATGAGMMRANRSDNIALASVDVDTSQVIAMVGSSDWRAPVYGEVNAATSLLEPGSSIKPLLDYAPLFQKRSGQNYAPGVVLADENIDSIYCAGSVGSCKLRNYTGRFYGNVTIRQSLANSLNIPAVKALYLNGVENSLKVLHDLGDKSYCEKDSTAGLSMAIGSGCQVRPIEHANAYASIARGGKAKELSYVLEVKDPSDKVLEAYKDTEGEEAVNEEVAYMVANILGDASARGLVFGAQAYAFGFRIPGVWTGTKTGTTTTTDSTKTKDSWIASFSTAVSTVVWNGNHDGSALGNSSNNLVRRVVHNYMASVHHDLYAKEGKWKSGDEPVKPTGISKRAIGGRYDIWPSWFKDKASNSKSVNLVFNKYTKMLAAACTPEEYKVSITATKTVDPMTKREIWSVPDGYNREVTDDCSYSPPAVSLYMNGEAVRVSIAKGSAGLSNYEVKVNGTTTESGAVNSTSFELNYTAKVGDTVMIAVTDTVGYTATFQFKIKDV